MSESSEDYSNSDIDYVLPGRKIKKQGLSQAEIEKEKQIERAQTKKQAKTIYKNLLRVSSIIGDLETIKFLIETHKVDLSKTDAEFNPLYEAFFQGHYDISKYLLEHGADPLVRNDEDEIPLSDENYDKVVEYARQLMKEEITKNKK